MVKLLAFSRAVDTLNSWVGRSVKWLILASVLVSAGNATSRYLFNIASNAWLELQWYLYAAVFMLCAGYTLMRNEHVRIDTISQRWSDKTRNWIDIIGLSVFMLPVCLYIVYMSTPAVLDALLNHEVSQNAGGLVRWPARAVIPLGFALLSLQCLSEVIKRIAFLRGLIENPLRYAEPAAMREDTVSAEPK